MAVRPPELRVDDLSSGDALSAAFDWSGFALHHVDRAHHSLIDLGYDALWQEFGHTGMERRDVIHARLRWPKAQPSDGYAMRYEMSVVTHGQRVAAVTDQTVIVDAAASDSPVTVHLSHLFVAPEFRRSGLAGWMRTMPVVTARRFYPKDWSPRRITIVAEVEAADRADPLSLIRLRSFEKAGYWKVDPRMVSYFQPDFRSADEIDRDGGPVPVPYSLLLRRITTDSQQSIAATELRTIVTSLYAMYQRTMRPQDIVPNWELLATYPRGGTNIPLVGPTSV